MDNINKRKLGSKKEQEAANFLKTKGYSIKELNFQCRMGEIDIVATKEEYLVFVEVKYRSTINQGFPEEAVHFKKQKSISKVAAYYLMKHGIWDNVNIRFDVVVIYKNEMKLIEHAFEYIQ